MSEAVPFSQWRAALAGGKPGMHLDEPWCGYFQTRDPKATKLDGRRWPRVACAIWPGPDGQLLAERGGVNVPVDWVWPYCAKHPIPYETYAYWHQHHKWPEEAVAA